MFCNFVENQKNTPMPEALNTYIDYTILKPETTLDQVLEICKTAESNHYKAVCIPPCYVAEAYHALRDCEVRVCTVVGFPLGYSTRESKEEETRLALLQGADEIDMVINLALFRSGAYGKVGAEIESLASLCHASGKLLKVIIESGLMNREDVRIACELCAAAGADFVKTSTGFNGTGAEIEKVEWMRAFLPKSIQIKASGGIRTLEVAQAMIGAGADRIGTSTAF